MAAEPRRYRSFADFQREELHETAGFSLDELTRDEAPTRVADMLFDDQEDADE